MTTGTWFVAVVTKGLTGGLATGQRVAVRLTVTGTVHVLASGGATAVLSLAAARGCLETVRTGRAWRPLRASGQSALSFQWDRLREARRFDLVPRKWAA